MLWEVDLSWSQEAERLREVAVAAAKNLTPQLVKDTIRTLRIVDKKVCGSQFCEIARDEAI